MIKSSTDITIVFFTDEDFAKDDENLACTAYFVNVGYADEAVDMWRVRVADPATPTVHPVIDEDTTGTGVKHFDTPDELIEWMQGFGFKPV